jgi:transcriptional regulator with XRE-family HTH domain
MNNRIKQFRLKSKLTQQQLAELMDVTRQAVTRWESGTVEPSTENLISLAQIFDCSVDELICNDLVAPKEKIIIKEVLIKEDKKPSFWNINKANIFLYIVSVIAFLTYLVLRFTTNYSITVVGVVLIPIIIISTVISLICNSDEIKDKNNFRKLILPPIFTIISFVLLGILLEF